jgi:hypothetical protein
MINYEEGPGGVWVVRPWHKMSFHCKIPLKKIISSSPLP